MQHPKKTGKSKTQFGLFLFFVVGLFILQIAFAFTIHGDIGPQNDIVPCIDRPASPILVGRIDSLVSNAKAAVPLRVSPEGAFAPASRMIHEHVVQNARIETETISGDDEIRVRKTQGHRYCEYLIRSGDTLEKISKKLYGNSSMVQSLIRLNRIRDERSLQLGATLLVPHTGLLNTVKIL
ncbi:MAG: hypothetical protein Kow0029_27830 [Candidatus Rifleibacteriota bacterium]